jgi:hypothetical protein
LAAFFAALALSRSWRSKSKFGFLAMCISLAGAAASPSGKRRRRLI